MYNVFLFIHSWVRWITLLIAIAAVIKHVLGLIQKSEFDKPSRILMSAYSGMLDLQALIGITFLIVNWGAFSSEGFPMRQIEHAGTMIVAVIVAHLSSMWKEKEASIRYRNNLIVIIVSILLIVAGVLSLAGNRWVFRL